MDDERMPVDLDAAAVFMATHARTLDRRRFHELMSGPSRPEAVVRALDAYRNPDGGYGWALEPDLRSPESQPAGALHAFEVLEEIAPVTVPQTGALCDWLESISLPDGGIPFALPVTDPSGCAPWWIGADSSTSSLHITCAVAVAAHRVGRIDAAVATHPWLKKASAYCIDAIERTKEPGHTLELLYAVQFLDAVYETEPRAPAELARLAAFIPESGAVHVQGGTEEEMVRSLDFSPFPDRPARAMFSPELIAADLARLSNLQGADGGWPVEWATASPAAVLEWRGYLTDRAIRLLSRNGLVRLVDFA